MPLRLQGLPLTMAVVQGVLPLRAQLQAAQQHRLLKRMEQHKSLGASLAWLSLAWLCITIFDYLVGVDITLRRRGCIYR